MKNIFFALLGLILLPTGAFAYNSKAQANAALTIIASCTWYRMGKIQKSQMISMSKSLYKKKYGNPNTINWSNAISIAEKLDKQENLGCFK